MGGVRECGGELGTGYGVGESEGGGTVGLVKRGGRLNVNTQHKRDVHFLSEKFSQFQNFCLLRVKAHVLSLSNCLERQDLIIFNFLGCLLEFFRDLRKVVVIVILDKYLYSALVVGDIIGESDGLPL